MSSALLFGEVFVHDTYVEVVEVNWPLVGAALAGVVLVTAALALTFVLVRNRRHV